MKKAKQHLKTAERHRPVAKPLALGFTVFPHEETNAFPGRPGAGEIRRTDGDAPFSRYWHKTCY
jgi:hypothetical protein